MAKQQVQRAELGVDGNCGYALLGNNLQEGEAEFETVVCQRDEPLHKAEDRASRIAYARLKARLDPNNAFLTYCLGVSHPKYC